MKCAMIDLPMMKPKTAQYLLKKAFEENKTVLDVFLELADNRAEETIMSTVELCARVKKSSSKKNPEKKPAA